MSNSTARGFSHVMVAAATAVLISLPAGTVQAAGEVTEIHTGSETATPTRYDIDGQTYTWGMGSNQIMDGFTANGVRYVFANSADRVELRRDDVADVSSGNPCGVFVERLGAASDVLSANYPSDGSNTGNCDMADMLASRVVNRGALNLFSNTGPNPKNVERVDYLFDRGVLTPLSANALSISGHVVAEKSGNNPLQIAAVTSVDVFGQPASYGPLIYIHRNGCADSTICYGITNLEHNYTFFQNDSKAPQGFPSFLKDSTEYVGMAFVSLSQLGLSTGEIYYGFSYFPEDVDASIHNLVDVSTFPDDTNDQEILFGDGPDIYGGVSGFYVADSLSVASGAVFKDENGDGEFTDDEAGISDIALSLYVDSNGDGVFDQSADEQLGSTFNSDINGEFRIPGLDNGVYFLVLDEADQDLPPALTVIPGTNPAMIVINGDDADGINFAFISTTGATDNSGTDAGSADAGAGDAGATDTGSDDSGATDAGVDSGVADAGSDDSGATDAGVDSGVADAGSDDSGATDAGTVDAGTGTAGATDDGDVSIVGDGDAGSTNEGVTDDGFLIINDGVNETVANPDFETVTQGSTKIINVLANDTNAAGGELIIIDGGESANATIENKDGVIRYTPNFGFIGMDSFLYVIEDSAGTQATGTVSVNVLRFSDINKNGENDFDECQCTNLTIEVGVEGTALGRSSWVFLLFLALFGAIRTGGLRRISPVAGATR